MTDGAAILRQIVQRRVDAEGLHPLARRTGLPIGQIRSIYQGRAPLLTTVSRVCAALGYELTIRPVPASREAPPAPLRSASDLSPRSSKTDLELSDPPAGASPEPVSDRRLAEILAVLADEWEALNEAGRVSLSTRIWTLHPELRERAAARAGRRLARLARGGGRA